MQSRRNFIGKVATGLAGTLATSNVLGANDRIRLGIIGPGDRGTEILREGGPGGKPTVHSGHQGTSSGAVADAGGFLTAELMGTITAIHAHMYRNTPHGKPQWARPLYPDMTPENIIWKSFQGDAKPHD